MNNYIAIIKNNIYRFGLHLLVYSFYICVQSTVYRIFWHKKIPPVFDTIIIYGILLVFGLSYLEYRGYNGKKILRNIGLTVIIFSALLILVGKLAQKYGPDDPKTEALSQKWGQYGKDVWWLP